MINPRPKILDYIASMDYAVFEEGDWNLNIIGVRKKNGTPDKFDDTMVVCYKKNGLWQEERWKVTTDPGLYHLFNPSRLEGTAILCPGQYRGAWKLGLHRGSYKALVQRKPVKVFRDASKNEMLDMDPNTVQEGLFGINIHRSNPRGSSTIVNKWSAGCQVFSSIYDYLDLIHLCEKQEAIGYSNFTYTLIEEP
tara:strand:+ start:3155 stop:3736 length:582 start_codon:yes stop_codon:yes gene_type:complete